MTTPFAHKPQAPLYRGAMIGHSQVAALSGYPSPHKAWPHVLERFLRLRGARVAIANYGKGGDTSADALARVHAFSRFGTPDFAGVWVDVNDPKLALVTRTTTGTGGVAEVVTITQGGNNPTTAIIAGTFTVTFGANTSAPIAYNASTAAVQTALNAMASIASAGNVTVTGSPGAWTVTFNSVGVRSLMTTDITSMLTLYTKAIVMAIKHNAYGPWDTENAHRGRQQIGPAAVATEASLPQYGRLGQRHVVMADGAANSGCTPEPWMVTQGILAASVGGAGSGGLSVWECCEPKAGLAGWHRVAVPGQAALGGCSRIFVMGTNYYNWPTGGDTPSTPSTYDASLRTALDAVVTAEQNPTSGQRATDPWVIRTDLYGYQRARIIAGTDPNFSADTALVGTTAYSQAISDHFVVSGTDNLHMNNQGHHVAALAVLAGGPGGTAFPSSWLTAIGAS